MILLILICGCFSFLLVRINSYISDYILVSVEEGSISSNASSSNHLADLKKELEKKDSQFTLLVYLVILIVGGCTSYLVIRFTHRVVGPVYRFKKVLETAIRGDYSTRITLRKNDYLKDLADTFNELLATLEKKR